MTTASNYTLQWITYSLLVVMTCVGTYSFYQYWHQDWVVYRQAETRFQQKQFAEAARLYKRSIELGVPTSVAALNLAISYVASGNIEVALPLYREYLKSHPDDKQGRLAFAKALSWTGHGQEAEEEFRRILDEADDGSKEK